MILVAQLVGIVGVVCIIAAWQFNKRRTILYIELVSSLVWTLHYILLGAYAGAGMNFISAVRNLLFAKYRDKIFVFWLMAVAFTVAAAVTWQNWTSILPYIGSMIGVLSMWQKSPRTIRWTYLFVPPFWFVYNMLNGSYPGMVGDTISFCAIVAGIYRFDIVPWVHRNGKARA